MATRNRRRLGYIDSDSDSDGDSEMMVTWMVTRIVIQIVTRTHARHTHSRENFHAPSGGYVPSEPDRARHPGSDGSRAQARAEVAVAAPVKLPRQVGPRRARVPHKARRRGTGTLQSGPPALC